MHDSSACIVRDGELLFAVAEERISRVKHDARFPVHAVEACLGFANVRAEQVDEVCFGWQTAGPVFRHDLKMYWTGQWPATYLNVLNSSRHFLSMWHQESGARVFERTFGTSKPRMRFVEHHLAHAISAYGYSGFDDAAIVIMDGRGAWEATSIWHGKNGRIEHVQTIPFPNSIGGFYSAFTDYLGFVPNSDEWKVMGLAPYGKPGVNLDAFIHPEAAPYRVYTKRLNDGRTGGRTENASGIAAVLGPPRAAEGEIEERHKNIAYAVQDYCEREMMSVVGLGVAFAAYLEHGGRLPIRAMRHAYLGPGFDDEAIETALKTYKLRYSRIDDPAVIGAELLAQGKILGWFQGRMEFGPRGLGSRSILADPRDPEMTAKVNNAVKFREWWRPFAPSITKEAAADFVESATDSPFMILTAQVRAEKRGGIPAVTHIDGSACPQTVEREVNPLYWRLIDEFGKHTGVPVVMNTSFNLRGEAIVHTPTDAVRTFFSSGMDALLIGSFLVEK